MSTVYLASLAAVLVVLVVLRLVAPQPAAVTERRARLAPTDLAILAVGVVLLVLHCGSMFYRASVRGIGLDGYAAVVDRFGPASMVLYSVPAFLVVVALRRLQPLALAVVAATLVAVGVTMYDGVAVDVHLTAIFVTVVCLALAVVFGSRPTLHTHRSVS